MQIIRKAMHQDNTRVLPLELLCNKMIRTTLDDMLSREAGAPLLWLRGGLTHSALPPCDVAFQDAIERKNRGEPPPGERIVPGVMDSAKDRAIIAQRVERFHRARTARREISPRLRWMC